MSGSPSAISAPLFYEPSASKEDRGEFKNWLFRSIKWIPEFFGSFDGAYHSSQGIRYASTWIGMGLTPRVESGGSGSRLLRSATIMRGFGSSAEHLLNAFRIPEALNRVVTSLKGVYTAFTGDAAKRKPDDKDKGQAIFKAALSVNDLADPVSDAFTLVAKDLKLINPGSVVSQVVDGVASGSLFVTSTVRGVKSGWDVASSATKMNGGGAATVQAERKQVVVGLLNLAKWISFFALSVIGLVGLIVAGIPAWMALAAMTSALVAGVLAMYATKVLVGREIPVNRHWLSKAIADPKPA